MSIVVLSLLIILAVVLIVDGIRQTYRQPYAREDFAMGSFVTQRLYGKNTAESAQEIIDAVLEVENKYISWRSSASDVAKINQNAGVGTSVRVNPFTYQALEKALDLFQKSGGAYNPLLGALTQAWDFDGNRQTVPQTEIIVDSLPLCNPGDLSLDKDHQVSLKKKGEIIDMGGIGKGLACDVAADILKTSDCSGGVVSVGGSILVFGEKPDGSLWEVAVRDPFAENGSYIGKIHLSEGFISTSGDYEKYFVQDGVTYHHILNPQTGYPAKSALKSVTIVCNSGLISDGLSTACYVLGYEASLPLLEQYDAKGVFIFQDGEIRVTDGLDFEAYE